MDPRQHGLRAGVGAALGGVSSQPLRTAGPSAGIEVGAFGLLCIRVDVAAALNSACCSQAPLHAWGLGGRGIAADLEGVGVRLNRSRVHFSKHVSFSRLSMKIKSAAAQFGLRSVG